MRRLRSSSRTKKAKSHATRPPRKPPEATPPPEEEGPRVVLDLTEECSDWIKHVKPKR
jgi:hypothetical protein